MFSAAMLTARGNALLDAAETDKALTAFRMALAATPDFAAAASTSPALSRHCWLSRDPSSTSVSCTIGGAPCLRQD